MSSVTGTEGLFYYHVWLADVLVPDDIERAMAAVDAMMEHDKRGDDEAVGELWATDGRFMVCVPVEGDTRHFAKEGWTRIV